MPNSLTIRRKRLAFQCQHRGSKELDYVLGRFAENGLAALSDADVPAFEAFLEEPEARLWDWLSGMQPPPGAYAKLVAQIRGV